MRQAIVSLLKKEVKTELRQKAAINGILLYVISTSFIAYLVFSSIEDLSTWIALYWITLIFASTNASINAFKEESGRAYLYYYSLVKPQHLIIAKSIYQSLLLCFIGFLNWICFSLFLGNPIENNGQFAIIILLSSLGLSGTFTLISAIASKTNNNASLLAILSFPILLPVLLTSIKASMLSGLGFEWQDIQLYMGLLGLIYVICLALSYVLFPYIWRS